LKARIGENSQKSHYCLKILREVRILMSDIAIVYDRSETDELGIKLTAEEEGLDLKFIPFHKTVVEISDKGFHYRSRGRNYNDVLEGSRVILNRTQSKSRRILASAIFEAMDKHVINPHSVEMVCQSKIKTLLKLQKHGVSFPKTVYIPCNVQESRLQGGKYDYSNIISDLITGQLGMENIVLKPDGGTHGRGIRLARGRTDLDEMLLDITPSIINPSGVVAQEFIPKWFYDLRLIVEKEKNKDGFCHPTAMARGGFKDFRTNTYLGNMVFRVNLPPSVRAQAEKCGEAIGEDAETWVLALDAMPYIGDDESINDQEIRDLFEKLRPSFNKIQDVKKDDLKKRRFQSYNRKLEDNYASYMSEDPYISIQKVIQDSLERKKDSILFHEGNACPEFWEQTRLAGGVNIAHSLVRCVKSILD
jgi:glutathione synthase/RimK-type ligase-like ATP-grasp enzyme